MSRPTTRAVIVWGRMRRCRADTSPGSFSPALTGLSPIPNWLPLTCANAIRRIWPRCLWSEDSSLVLDRARGRRFASRAAMSVKESSTAASTWDASSSTPGASDGKSVFSKGYGVKSHASSDPDSCSGYRRVMMRQST